MNTPQQGENTGVRIDPIRPSDWRVSGESGAVRKPLIADGQYDLYLPDEESQHRSNPHDFDVSACVTFSALNNLETILNTQIALNLLSAKQLQFLKDEGYLDHFTGKVNFSDRYTAKLSGTTTNGNSLPAVGDSIRKTHGLIPEKDWPFPEEVTASTFNGDAWAIYYKDVPASLIAKGLRFLQHFDVGYEWVVIQGATSDVPSAVRTALPFGPIQLVTMVCSPWNSNEGMPPIPACGCGTGHATQCYGYRTDGAYKDFDSYKSYRKLLAADYCITYAMQYHINEVSTVTGPFTRDLTVGSTGDDVRLLQVYLNHHGFPVATSPATGSLGHESTYYGSLTRNAVARLQGANGISPAAGYFGPKTRTYVNAHP